MKIVKVLFVLTAGLLALAAGVWQFSLKDQAAYARLAAAYSAKQVCSCRFIGERELQSCLGDFTDDISALTIAQHNNTITAKAPMGLARSTASYSPELGCFLVK